MQKKYNFPEQHFPFLSSTDNPDTSTAANWKASIYLLGDGDDGTITATIGSPPPEFKFHEFVYTLIQNETPLSNVVHRETSTAVHIDSLVNYVVIFNSV